MSPFKTCQSYTSKGMKHCCKSASTCCAKTGLMVCNVHKTWPKLERIRQHEGLMSLPNNVFHEIAKYTDDIGIVRLASTCTYMFCELADEYKRVCSPWYQIMRYFNQLKEILKNEKYTIKLAKKGCIWMDYEHHLFPWNDQTSDADLERLFKTLVKPVTKELRIISSGFMLTQLQKYIFTVHLNYGFLTYNTKLYNEIAALPRNKYVSTPYSDHELYMARRMFGQDD